MTHRQRILAALNHTPPDRVPVDLGSNLATSIDERAYAALRHNLGLAPEDSPALLSFRAATVIPAGDMVRRFDLDARPLLAGSPDSRPDRRVSEDTYVDEWGVAWTKPPGGHYINTGGPFQGLVDPGLKCLESYDWPDPDDPGRYRGLRERSRSMHENSDYAVVLNLWVGPIHLCQFLRGFAEWLEDLLLNQLFAEGLLGRRGHREGASFGHPRRSARGGEAPHRRPRRRRRVHSRRRPQHSGRRAARERAGHV